MADEAGRVGPGTKVRGAIRGAGNLVVEGEVEGQIVLADLAVLAPGSRIQGEVKARAVDLAGRVEGQVETGRLDVRAAAVVAAELTATTVSVEDGATLQGYLRMQLDLPSGLEG